MTRQEMLTIPSEQIQTAIRELQGGTKLPKSAEQTVKPEQKRKLAENRQQSLGKINVKPTRRHK